jgi:SAM-dependent methyltransferase
MRWLVKAAVQKGISALPRAESANYLLRRHVSRSLPASETRFERKFSRAVRHLAALEKYGPGTGARNAVFYEFGAGWDLAVQLSYWCLGVDRQLLVDIRPNLRFELVDVTVERLHRLRPALEKKAGKALRDPSTGAIRSARDLEEHFGIAYLAPRDARRTGLGDSSVDFVSNTATLEHIPADDLVSILRECRRLLRPAGVMSSRIDLHDHYVRADPGLTPYNFLRYSERSWRFVNSRIHYQSRLRRPDYLGAFADAGFEILEERSVGPTPDDLEVLRAVGIHREFRDRYSLEDLGVRAMNVVARPSRSPNAAEELGDLAG